MNKALLIKGGRLVDPTRKISRVGNLLLKDDKISWVSEGRENPVGKAYDTLTAKGLIAPDLSISTATCASPDLRARKQSPPGQRPQLTAALPQFAACRTPGRRWIPPR